MLFEYDEAKSRINKDKHGIDFVEAQALWLDEKHLEIAARSSDEPRCFILGKINRHLQKLTSNPCSIRVKSGLLEMSNKKYWTAVITYRGAVIRIISVRRSREKEKQLYDQ